MNKIYSRIKDLLLLEDSSGQGLLEYALIMILVAVIIIIVLVLLGPAVGNMYSNVIQNLPLYTPPP